jgi:hypothetical protein
MSEAQRSRRTTAFIAVHIQVSLNEFDTYSTHFFFFFFFFSS